MKRFKFFAMCLVFVSCILGSNVSIRANSYSTGKAIIPIYYQSTVGKTIIYVSNITDAPIDVTVTLYNTDGTLVTDDNNINTGRINGSVICLNYCDQNTDSTITFTLNPHTTGLFRTINSTTTYYGYGVIQWQQSGTNLNGLVATGTYNKTTEIGESINTIDINNGLPF